MRRPHARAALSGGLVASCVCIFFLLPSPAQAALVNARVTVGVDATASVARVQVMLRVRNDGPEPQSAVRLVAPVGSGAIVVGEGDKLTKTGRLVAEKEADGGGYGVVLRKPLAAGDEIALAVSYEQLDAIVPSPSEIAEGESHYVLYAASAYFASPYVTESATTVIKMSGVPVAGVVHAPEPNEVSGTTLTLGPYSNVPAFANAPVAVRFKNDRGMLVAASALREMYVSHWGNVAVKEEFLVENSAARHVGRWSRVDYDKGLAAPLASRTAIGDVWVNLPKRSTNVVYKDLVGNITTSRLREPNAKHRPMQLSFRFPLLGGWKNHFWYTYDVPLSDFSSSLGSSHRLSVPVFPSVNERFLCRRLAIRIMLPEGATNVNVLAHPSLEFASAQTAERTTLNYFGRTVVTLTAPNVYASSAAHEQSVVVTYDFMATYLLAAPLIVAAGIFALFLAAIVYAGSEVMLVSDQDDPAACATALVTDQHMRIAAAIRVIDADHAALDALFSRLTSVDDARTVAPARMALESRLRDQEAELASAAAELRRLGRGGAEVAGALAQRFGQKRDLCMRAMSSRLMLVEQRMTEEKYVQQMNGTLSPALVLVADELELLADALIQDL